MRDTYRQTDRQTDSERQATDQLHQASNDHTPPDRGSGKKTESTAVESVRGALRERRVDSYR